jgi:hypothetical protein
MPLPFLVVSSYRRWSSVQGESDICTRLDDKLEKTREENPYHVRGIRKIMITITTVAMHQYGSGGRRPCFPTLRVFAFISVRPFRYAALKAYNRECGRND